MEQRRRVFATATVAVLLIGLSGCAQGASSPPMPDGGSAVGRDVIAPLTVSIADLEGEDIELVTSQVLNITVGDSAVGSVSGGSEDEATARFTAGYVADSAEFNPGFEAIRAGSTKAWVTDASSGDTEITFTITVSERP